MTGYVYRGSGDDALTPDLDEPAPDYPLHKTYTAAPYVDPVRPTCAAGQHHAAGTTDRDGARLWVCRRGCGATATPGGTWTP